MSELLIIFILLVPVALVIFILNRSQKKNKKLEQDKLAGYLQPHIAASGIVPTYQKELVYQHLTIDEKAGKLLLINWKDFEFSHEWLLLADIKKLSVQTIKQTVMENGQNKPEIIVTQVGIELVPDNADERRFLTFYSHLEHNIYHLADLTKEATQLCERLQKRKAAKPAKV